jgi:hypothetical protein
MNFAKEKAIELVNEYMSLSFSEPIFGLTSDEAKQCALIAINEILDFSNALFINEGSLIHQHLLDVKSEIEKL